MRRLIKIDNCKYCACLTTMTIQGSIEDALQNGDLQCWNCHDDDPYIPHTEFDIFENNQKIWCGHKPKCTDVGGN